MGSNSGPFVFGTQQGSGGAPVAANATAFNTRGSGDDGSFASTNPSFKQQPSRLAVVHAMVQHEQDTAEHRKKSRAKDRAASRRQRMKKPTWEPIQLQGLNTAATSGSSGTSFGQSSGFGFQFGGQTSSMGPSDSAPHQDDEDDLISQLNDMDIDETVSDSEPELSESATTVDGATSDVFRSGQQSPAVTQSFQSFSTPSPNVQSSPASSSNAGVSGWRPPVNYFSKPTIQTRHDQAAPSFHSPPTSLHAPMPVSQLGFRGQQQQPPPSQAAPLFAQARPSAPLGRFEFPPVQPLLSPFTTPPARFPPSQSQRPGSYFGPQPSSQFPPSMPPNAPLPVTFTRFGSQANNAGSRLSTLNPLAPEFIPRWKMDGIQRFTGRARPFQRLLEDYQRLQSGQQNKQQELQLQLQLALQLQMNSPQVALQNALEQALQNSSNFPAPPPQPGAVQNWQYVDPEREAALRDALQRAMQNIPPLTLQNRVEQNHNGQPMGPQPGQPPQAARHMGPPFGPPQPPASFHGFR